MAKTKVSKIELVGFRLSTPKHYKINGVEKVDIDRYDHEFLKVYFEELLKKGSIEIKRKLDGSSITLLEYSENDISSFGFGKLVVFKTGKTQRILDEENLGDAGLKEKDQGLENEIYFVINKLTGIILVERDYDKIVKGKLLNALLYHNKRLMYDYIEEFNSKNFDSTNGNRIEIYKNKIVHVNPLPSQELFDELENFSRIKRFKIVKRVHEEAPIRDGIGGCAQEIESILNSASLKADLGQNVVSVEYFIDERGEGLKKENARELLQNIYASSYFEDFIIAGADQNKRPRIITSDTVTKKFFIDMEIDVEGHYFEPSKLFINLVEELQRYIDECYDLNETAEDVVNEYVVNP